MINKRNVFILLITTSLALSLQGCDQLTTLKEKIMSSLDKKKDAPAAGKKEMPKSVTPTKPPQSPVPSNKALEGDVLAKVGTWTITIEEFKDRLSALQEVVPEYSPGDPQQDRMILQELINQQLLVEEAQKQGIGEDKDIQEAVKEFRRTLLVQELARRKIEEIEVSEEEAKEFYDLNEQDFIEPAQWTISEIVVSAEEEAKETLIELYKGADFGETAKMKSLGPTAAQGGSLGEMAVFDFPKQGDIVSALDVGEISRVFKGPQGFYIVKLDGKRGGEQKTYEEIKEDIKAGLMMLKQQQTMMDYLKELEDKAQIDINEKLLEE